MFSKEYVEKVNDMVKYQDGSIVSRMVADKETGRITMFAFAKGQGISEQLLPYDSVLFITEGKAEVVLDSEVQIVGQDTIIVIPQNCAHEIYAIENFKILSIVIGAL